MLKMVRVCEMQTIIQSNPATHELILDVNPHLTELINLLFDNIFLHSAYITSQSLKGQADDTYGEIFKLGRY